MNISLFAMMIGAAMSANALERSVPLPYQMNNPLANGGVMVKVPSCSISQYVGVSGTQFVCRDIPNCADGETFTRQNDVFLCKAPAVAKVDNGPQCGTFTTVQSSRVGGWEMAQAPEPETYILKVFADCKTGMATTAKKTSKNTNYTALTACPAGYAIHETGRSNSTVMGTLISCSSCRGSSGMGAGGRGNASTNPPDAPAYIVTSINYTCMKQ
jgi:hypothetical protein